MFAGLLAFIIHYRCSAWTFRRNLSISNTERLWQALSSIRRSSATLSAYLSDLWVNLGAARRPSALIWSRMMKVGGDGWGWGWGWVGLWLLWLLMDVCREIQWAEWAETNKPRWTDGDLEAPVREVEEKMKEGNWQMYRQTNWSSPWPRGARGDGDQKHTELCCCYSAATSVGPVDKFWNILCWLAHNVAPR